MTLTWYVVGQLLLSVLIGGVIGAEREYRNKSAGFRTMMLICLGAALFTMFSMQIEPGGAGRIASNIVTGIGFLGAGVIFKDGAGINGITTAATIWVTAALGMGIGAGYEEVAIWGTIMLMPILMLFTYIELWIDRISHTHNYKITCPFEKDITQQYEKLFRDYHLSCKRTTYNIAENTFTGNWEAHGAKRNHERFIQHILNNSSIKAFEF